MSTLRTEPASQGTPNAVEALENPEASPPAPAGPVRARGLLCDSAEALDAQLALWKLQLSVAAVQIAVSVVLGLLLFALAVYGFTLLDEAARWPLTQQLPPWVSPLVRGAVYLAFPLILLRPALGLVCRRKALAPTSIREEHTHDA